MKQSELQQKSTAELSEIITQMREELRKIRFGAAGSGMRNTHAARNVRREIARALTELKKREG